MIFLALIFILLTPSFSGATLWYIDNSCTFNGNGQDDVCAASAGAVGAFNVGQTGMAAAFPGDTVYWMPGTGTYQPTCCVSDAREVGGFHPVRSGTTGAPIIITSYDLANRPLIRNCTSTATNCDTPTFTAAHHGNIQFIGLNIRGSFSLFGGQNPSGGGLTGLVVRDNECTMGWNEDGNWSCIYLENWTAAQVDHNYIHDIAMAGDKTVGTHGNSGGCIKLYNNTGTTVEFNTCKDVMSGTGAGGIDDKAASVSNIHQFNFFRNVPTMVRVVNQGGGSGSTIRGNIGADITGTCFKLMQDLTSVTYEQNTCLMTTGGGSAIYNERDDSTAHTSNVVTARLSIFSGIQSGQLAYEWYDSINEITSSTGNNAYTPSRTFTINGTDFSLASLITAGKEAGSISDSCTFNSTAGSGTVIPEFHPTDTGGGCADAGPGGTELGAYALATCIGHLCGASTTPDTTPPVMSNGVPTTGTVLSAGTTATTFSLNTDEAATCKYATSDLNYASMTLTFTTTGGTSHAKSLTPLSNGTAYTRYVRCIDVAGNPDTASLVISFSVASAASMPGSPTGFHAVKRMIRPYQ